MKAARFNSPVLGRKLREIRKKKGVCGPQLLARLMGGKHSWSAILKRERGDLRIDFDYLEDFCRALKLSDSEREEIMVNGRVNWLRTRSEHDKLALEYRGLVQSAKIRHLYSTGIIPGLVQTLDYAQAIIASYETTKSPESLARQRVEESQKWRRDRTRQTQIVCTENALYTPIGSPSTMIGQLQRLLQFEDEPFCEFRILPDSVFLKIPVQDDFEVIDQSYCICETRLGILTSEERTTAAKFVHSFEEIWSQAAMGLRRNKMIAHAIAHFQAMAKTSFQ